MVENPHGKSRIRAWLGLIVGILMILALPYVILPLGYSIPEFKKIADFIDARGIDASAIYYSELEACSVAEMNTRHTVYFQPIGPRVATEGVSETIN